MFLEIYSERQQPTKIQLCLLVFQKTKVAECIQNEIRNNSLAVVSKINSKARAKSNNNMKL